MAKQRKAQKEIDIPRGKLIGENGPGSLYVDTRGISYVISAVDKWYKVTKGRFDEEKLSINNARLQNLLGVNHFREVPKYRNKFDSNSTVNVEMKVPIQRFPCLHYCSVCGTLNKHFSPNSNERKKDCPACKKETVFLQFPVVVVCSKGHMTDFPFFQYVHTEVQAAPNINHIVKVDRSGSTILNWKLRCSCGAHHDLGGVTGQARDDSGLTPFQREMKGARCLGKKPWAGLKVHDEECEGVPTAILKNSLNVYRAETVSAISIADGSNKDSENSSIDDIRDAEYRYLSKELIDDDRDKLIVDSSFLGEKHSIIEEVNFVRRLEEVVVQTGFHRLSPSDEEETLLKAKDSSIPELMFTDSKRKVTWYPAKILYGEGVFIKFNTKILEEWNEFSECQERYNSLEKRVGDFYLKESFDTPISIMIHTLSHALAFEFSTKSGYPLVAIKEKLYKSNGNYGILLYVTDADKDGTYGGLVRLADKSLFKELFYHAMERIDWCSSDPVCSELGESSGQGLSNSNGSACHNCSYIPDTSCSYRNCFLDRDFVGRKDSGNLGIGNTYPWF